MAVNAKSPVVIIKVFIILLGIVVMGLGIHSHFKSSWKRIDKTGIRPYKLCYGAFGGTSSGSGFITFPGFTIRFDGTDCPKIAMEEYFVSIVIICVIASVLNLVAMIFLDMSSGFFKFIDMLYHGIATILLVIAGIVYIISAEQIKKLGFDVKIDNRLLYVDFLHGEKIAAGSLSLLLGLLYGIAAVLITTSRGTRSRSSNLKL